MDTTLEALPQDNAESFCPLPFARSDMQAQSSGVLLLTLHVTQHQQVLVLTHELASIEEITPYHRIRLSPMPVVEMAGRSRALKPPCARGASVYYWWRGSHTLLFLQRAPDMQHERLPSETCGLDAMPLSV